MNAAPPPPRPFGGAEQSGRRRGRRRRAKSPDTVTQSSAFGTTEDQVSLGDLFDDERPALHVPGWLRWAVAQSVVVAGFLVVLLAGLPTLGEPWRPAGLVAGIAVGGAGGVAATRAWPSAARRARTIGVVAAVAVSLAAGIGVRDAIVIDGRVVRAGSEQAVAFDVAHQLHDDLYAIADVDALVIMSDVDVRTRVARFEDSAREMSALIRRWADNGDLPDGFAPIAERVKVAGDAALSTLERRLDLLDEPSDAAARDVAAWREVMTAEVLAAGRQLMQVSAQYGVSLIPSADQGAE